MRFTVSLLHAACLGVLGPALAAQDYTSTAPSPASATSQSLPLKHAPAPTKPAITAADLMTRLYIYADDSMMGRQAGSEYNLKSTAYIEGQVRKLGLVPAGDAGGYFQAVPLVKQVFDSSAPIAVGDVNLVAWTDFLPRDQGSKMRPVDGVAAVYAGVWGDSTMLTADQGAGKLVVIGVRTGNQPNGLPAWQISRFAVTNRYRSAAGIAVVSMDYMSPGFIGQFRSPFPTLKGAGGGDTLALPSYIYITSAVAKRLFGVPLDSAKAGATGAALKGNIRFVEVAAPARNVVAILPGSDPKLKNEYVAIGAHNDHIGFDNTPLDHDSLRAFNTAAMHLRDNLAPNTPPNPQLFAGIHVNVDSLHAAHPARRDSIFNGADDDGSGTASVLEIAEQFATTRAHPKRSILFVWHTGEELGLFGSQWFTDHPTVPRDSIVAQLNMDMVGRGDSADTKGGGPTYLMLIGSRRLSTELGDIVESVNRQEKRPFTFDYSWDANGHPENVYCRSDHYEYARYGIPITFFTTGLHQDYHQLTDEPQYIDYEHMARVAQLVHDVAVAVANLDHRVVVDKPKPDLNAPCRQ
jgi:hypothetical protein